MTPTLKKLSAMTTEDLAAWVGDAMDGLTIDDLKRLLMVVFLRLAKLETEIKEVADNLTDHEIDGHGD